MQPAICSSGLAIGSIWCNLLLSVLHYACWYFQRKCEQYWAENIGDSYTTPDNNITVVTTSVMPFADFVIRTLSVKNVSQGLK